MGAICSSILLLALVGTPLPDTATTSFPQDTNSQHTNSQHTTSQLTASWITHRYPTNSPSSKSRWHSVENTVDSNGYTHHRLEHYYQGIKVAFDEIRIHHPPSKAPPIIEGRISHPHTIRSILPSLGLPEIEALIERRSHWQIEQAKLVIVGESIQLSTASLAYQLRIIDTSYPNRPRQQSIFVDAHSGRILKRITLIHPAENHATMVGTTLLGENVEFNITTAGNQEVALLKDIVSIPGGQVWGVNASQNNAIYQTSGIDTPFDDSAAITGHWFIQKGLEYFDTAHGWKNWDLSTRPASPGGWLVSVIHQGVELNNAYFTTYLDNGRTVGTIAFGDGNQNEYQTFTRCRDIATHELSHGLIQGTAGLIYHNQSGALSEHFADIFGWLQDLEDPYIGEDCIGPSLIALGIPGRRNICEPNDIQLGSARQPDHMNYYEFHPNTEEGDWGGVHINSGILNRAACIVRDQIGAEKLAKIWFQTLRFHLGPTSTFAQMVTGTAAACNELSLSAQDCAAVAGAMATVGLSAQTVGGACGENSTYSSGICICDEGFQVDDLGTTCSPLPTLDCPNNAYSNNGACYCHDGYTLSPVINACVPTQEAPCPSNSHRQGDTCICNECYQGTPQGDGQGCEPILECVICENPLEYSVNGQCDCLPGVAKVCGEDSLNYVLMEDGQTHEHAGPYCCQDSDPCDLANNGQCDCHGECSFDITDCGSTSEVATPMCGGYLPGDCGNETWYGRCDGDTLVYCASHSGEANQIVLAVACATNNSEKTCGLDEERGFYNCIPKEEHCNGVPTTGQCVGNNAQYCADGLLYDVNCANRPCQAFSLYGTNYNYCYPCPASASIDAAGECQCPEGKQVSEDGMECIASPTAPDDSNPEDQTGPSPTDSSDTTLVMREPLPAFPLVLESPPTPTQSKPDNKPYWGCNSIGTGPIPWPTYMLCFFFLVTLFLRQQWQRKV